MIQVQDLRHTYGERRALDGVTFIVRPGEVAGLLGANGAGKSTLLRTAAGLQPADEGRVTLAGHDVWDAPMLARTALGYAAEEPSFHEDLSAAEYLSFVATVRGLEPAAAETRTRDLAARLDLAERLDDPVRGYSHGMRKKVSFMAAVIHQPQVLLCDEALEGFDAPSAIAAKEEIRALAAAGTAVLFSSHVTETMERLCDRAILLHGGRVARELTRADWGGGAEVISPLERMFLEMVRGGGK